MNSWSRLWLAALGPPLALFVLGTVWSAVDVFVLGNWDGKFGPMGTFKLGTLLIGSISVAFLIANIILVWLLRARIHAWSSRKVLVTSAITAAVTLFLLKVEVPTSVADRLIRVFSASELPVYLAVLGLTPLLVFAAVIGVLHTAEVLSEHRDA